MNLLAAERFARTLMDAHGLSDWKLRWSSSVRRLGRCTASLRTIWLSKYIVERNSVEVVRTIALHEICHALVSKLVGGSGEWHIHTTPEWRETAAHLGIDPVAKFKRKLQRVPKCWMGYCPVCWNTIQRHRRRKVSCGLCRPKTEYKWERIN